MKKFTLITCLFLVVSIIFSFLAIRTIYNKRNLTFSYYSSFENRFVNDVRKIDVEVEFDNDSFVPKVKLFSDFDSCKRFKHFAREQVNAISKVDFKKFIVLTVIVQNKASDKVFPVIDALKISGNKLSIKTEFVRNDNANINAIDIVVINKNDISLEGNFIVEVYNQAGEFVLDEICVI